VAVDPSGGGASAFSICSAITLANGSIQVLGVECLHTRDVRRTHELLASHITYIRTMSSILHKALAVLSFESNLAFESQHLLHHLTENGFRNWVSLAEGAHGGLGWLTTHERKESSALLLREAMRVGRVSYHPSFFSISLGAHAAKKRLGDEIRNFSVVVEAPKTHFAKTRKTYTGKLGGLQDDACISFQLVMAAMRTFFESPKYAQFSRQSARDMTS